MTPAATLRRSAADGAASAGKAVFDVRDLADADVIGLVNTFRSGDARGSWVRTLRFTHGEDAVPFARSLLQPGVEKQGYVVVSALAVLARRAPEAALEEARRLLRERRTFEVHIMAVHLLLLAHRGEDLDPIYEHIDRRFARPRRPTSAGDWEIPMHIMVCSGDRHAATHRCCPRAPVDEPDAPRTDTAQPSVAVQGPNRHGCRSAARACTRADAGVGGGDSP